MAFLTGLRPAARQELRRSLSGWTALMFLAAALLTLALGPLSESSGTEPGVGRRLPLLVVDNDSGALAAELTGLLRESALVYPLGRSPAGAADDYHAGRAAAILTIPEGFSAGLLAGLTAELDLFAAPEDPAALIIELAVHEAAARLNAVVVIGRQSVLLAEAVAPFSTTAARTPYLQYGLQAGRSLLDEGLVTTRLVQAPGAPAGSALQGTAVASPGQLVLWSLVLLLGAAPSLACDRDRILQAGPGSRMSSLSGRLVGRAAPALALMAFLVGLGLPLGANYGRSIMGSVLVLVGLALMGAALGLLLGALCRSERAARWWGLGLAAGLALLGGAWQPLAAFPVWLRGAVSWLPAAWAAAGLQNILVGSGELAIPAAAVLLGWAVLFLCTAWLALRGRPESKRLD